MTVEQPYGGAVPGGWRRHSLSGHASTAAGPRRALRGRRSCCRQRSGSPRGRLPRWPRPVASGAGPPSATPGRGAGEFLDALLQLHDPVEQRLGPRGAAGDVDVHRDHLVDPLEDVVALPPVGTTVVGAGAHRDHVLRLGHLLIELKQSFGLSRRVDRSHTFLPGGVTCRRSWDPPRPGRHRPPGSRPSTARWRPAALKSRRWPSGFGSRRRLQARAPSAAARGPSR